MADGSWQEVTVAAWQQVAPDRWRCLLEWGVWGTVCAGWYIHDTGKLIPLADEAAPGSRPGEGLSPRP
jgi:hypothetical protein